MPGGARVDRGAVNGVGGPSAPLLAELGSLPVQHLVAARLLHMLGDDDVTMGELGEVIATDPALSMQVIRLANSPYYGLRDPVGSVERAVVVVGLSTVRALAASAAFGLLEERGRALPEGFWTHAVATAVGSALVARRTGLPASEAFSAGLLHDVGAALLFRHAPRRYDAAVRAAAASGDLLAAERAAFGLCHQDAGALALAACRFPPAFVRAVAHHHGSGEQADPEAGPLAVALVAGEALAVAALGATEAPERVAPLEAALTDAGLDPAASEFLVEAVRAEAEALAGFLAAVA